MGSERYIIKKGRHYLDRFNGIEIRYTPSHYDCWKSRSFNTAIRVAKQVGGKVMKFNPVTGDISGGWK